MVNRASFAAMAMMLSLGVTVPSQSGAAAALADGGQRITVPQNLLVRIVVDRELSSAVASAGDAFPVHAAEDVDIDCYVVIRKGAVGRGEILTATPASSATPGSLSYAIDYVIAVDGKKIRLTTSADSMHNVAAAAGTVADSTRAAVMTSTATDLINRAGVASGALGMLGPVGGIASMAGGFLGHRKGRDSSIAASSIVPAYVLTTVHTYSNVAAANADGADYAQ